MNYAAEPTETWRKGFNTWCEMMEEIGFFTGQLKGLQPDELMSGLCDFALCRATAESLRQVGQLK